MDFIFTEKLLLLYCSCIGGDICENNYTLFAYLVTVFLYGDAEFFKERNKAWSQHWSVNCNVERNGANNDFPMCP